MNTYLDILIFMIGFSWCFISGKSSSQYFRSKDFKYLIRAVFEFVSGYALIYMGLQGI